MTPHRVFDGHLLRATLFNPDGARLFVSFRQRVADAGDFTEPTPVAAFADHGHAHLHLQSRWNDWYINAETEALETTLRALSSRYRAVRAMGFSMGGYAALRFAAALRLGQVVLVSPQVSIHPAAVPWDGRYADCAGVFDPDLGCLARRAGPELAGVLAYDPFRWRDRRNAREISALFPGLELCALAGGGHPATQIIRLGGSFGRIQIRLRQDRLDRRWVVQEHRKLRSDSAVYWSRLSKYANTRRRPALADTAGRVADLLKASDRG
ncbi:alpha/beta hydrolase [Rhodobacteraceae bacterium F11138]|nr:alpha/beta hydrolase [Rhodobacteraceae bacterium F11138]